MTGCAMDNNTATYAIAALALGYSLLSTWVMQKLGNPARIREIQQRQAQLQKEFAAAAKEKDEHKIKELDAKTSDMMPMLMESMVLQMKPMIVILPLAILASSEMKNWFPGYLITLPLKLPIFLQHFENFPNWRDLFGPVGWFWLCVIFLGLGISFIKSEYDKRKKSDSGTAPAAPAGPSA